MSEREGIVDSIGGKRSACPTNFERVPPLPGCPRPILCRRKCPPWIFVRHKSGHYYARAFGNNKEIWKSLGDRAFLDCKVGVEAGIDIPNVSRCLGHKDGGRLR